MKAVKEVGEGGWPEKSVPCGDRGVERRHGLQKEPPHLFLIGCKTRFQRFRGPNLRKIVPSDTHCRLPFDFIPIGNEPLVFAERIHCDRGHTEKGHHGILLCLARITGCMH